MARHLDLWFTIRFLSKVSYYANEFICVRCPWFFRFFCANIGLVVPSVSNAYNTEDYVVAIPSPESYVQISSQRSIVLSEESFGVMDDGYISNSDQQNVEPG